MHLKPVPIPKREFGEIPWRTRPAGWAADPGSRILVRLPNWLGDLMMARPLLAAVRPLLPEADIRIVAPAPLLELLSADLPLCRFEPWPTQHSKRSALAAHLRRWKPSCALILPPSFSSAWFALMSGARVRIGYREQWRALLLTHGLPRRARGELHLSAEYLALGRLVGLEPRALEPLELPDRARDQARIRLARLGVSPHGFAILGPGAAYGPAKRWAPERFAAVGRARVSQGETILLCGAAAERGACDGVAERIGAGAHVLAGETGLVEQAALCARANISLCNDSGLAHLSAASGAPTVAIFGSTSSAWTAPLGPRVRVLQHPPVCSPCFQRTCAIGYRCLEAVGVDEVVAACDALARQPSSEVQE